MLVRVTSESRCESCLRDHFSEGAIVQQQDGVMAWRRSRCESAWLHQFHRARVVIVRILHSVWRGAVQFGRARPFVPLEGIPPKRRGRRPSLVSVRGWCHSTRFACSWTVGGSIEPCSPIRRAPAFEAGG